MPITIEVNEKQLNEKEPLKMHFLPAKIDGDGPTNVDQYFNNYTRTDEQGFLTNALRGYPLIGEELEVPKGYKAVVLQETREPLSADAERILRIAGSFEKFTYWNYDKVPSPADKYKQAMQVINIAEALSKPVTEEQVLEELKQIRKIKAEREKHKLDSKEAAGTSVKIEL